MNDTRITLVGTALTTPERRVIEKSGAVVANFRVISNSRWKGKDGSWVDGANFRCRVVCWRRMADHVCASVSAGDPVIVHGRISTKEWKTETGELRISYEIDAEAVGHDRHRGVSVFTRVRHESPNSVVEDDESESRIDGELAHAYPPPGAEADEAHSGEDSGEDRRAGCDAGAGDGPGSGVPGSVAVPVLEGWHEPSVRVGGRAASR